MTEDVFQLEIEAARALAEWKFMFSTKVSEHATKLVRMGDESKVITLAHYREAAIIALKDLIVDLQKTDLSDGRQQAAA